MDIFIGGLIGISGIIIGSILTGYRELSTFRRERLEHIAFEVGKMNILMNNYHETAIKIVKSEPADFSGVDEFFKLSDQIKTKSKELNTMLLLHASAIDVQIDIYAKKLNTYIEESANLMHLLTKDKITESEFETKTNQLFQAVETGTDDMIKAISSEIYDKNIIRKLNRLKRWPSSLIRKK